MEKILVVDDEENIRSLIRKYGEFEGYEIAEAANGMEAVELCRKHDFDFIIMDVMMPELDGFSACAKIRETGKNTPVLMLSARGEEYDKIHGFELGVDDYVVKPFSPKELMMRVRAILSRAGKGEREKQLLEFGGLVIDVSAMVVYVDGQKAELSPKGYELLYYLAKNKGIALTREKLITEVWGYDFYGDDRTLDTHIKLLRSALGNYRDYIVTLRGVGYRFEA
ncbi:response regulator transcription factor [Christensenella timonensis]|uniref:response regulator transcription factor n=1 Tax=Christensenella timonensis TaxID=1816678 RepID=UPI00082F60FF|nr:response regulator transcription factor [Christensenella timonensis]